MHRRNPSPDLRKEIRAIRCLRILILELPCEHVHRFFESVHRKIPSVLAARLASCVDNVHLTHRYNFLLGEIIGNGEQFTPLSAVHTVRCDSVPFLFSSNRWGDKIASPFRSNVRAWNQTVLFQSIIHYSLRKNQFRNSKFPRLSVHHVLPFALAACKHAPSVRKYPPQVRS